MLVIFFELTGVVGAEWQPQSVPALNLSFRTIFGPAHLSQQSADCSINSTLTHLEVVLGSAVLLFEKLSPFGVCTSRTLSCLLPGALESGRVPCLLPGRFMLRIVFRSSLDSSRVGWNASSSELDSSESSNSKSAPIHWKGSVLFPMNVPRLSCTTSGLY